MLPLSIHTSKKIMDPIVKSYLNKNEPKKKEDSPYDHIEDVNTIIVSSHGDKEQKEENEIQKLKHKIEESYVVKPEKEIPPIVHAAEYNNTSVERQIQERAARYQQELGGYNRIKPRTANRLIGEFYRDTHDHKIAKKFSDQYIDSELGSDIHTHYDGVGFQMSDDEKKTTKAEIENINKVLDNEKLEDHHIEHIKNAVESHPINSPVRSKLDQKFGWFLDQHAHDVKPSKNNKDLYIDKEHLKSALGKGLTPWRGRIFSDRNMNHHHLNDDGTLTRVNQRRNYWEASPYSNTHPAISKDEHEKAEETRMKLHEDMWKKVFVPGREKQNLEKYTEDSREVNAYVAMKNLGHDRHAFDSTTQEQKERILHVPEQLSSEIKHDDPVNPEIVVHHGVTHGFDPSHDFKEHEAKEIEDDRHYSYHPATTERKAILMTHAKKALGPDKQILTVNEAVHDGSDNKFEATHVSESTGEVKKTKFEINKKPGYKKPETYIAHMPAFTSTSLDLPTAESFAKRRKDKDLGVEVHDLMSLKVPEKYRHGIYVDPISRNSGEHEYVLDQNHLIKYNSEPKYYVKDRYIIRHWAGEVIPKNDN